MLCYQDISGHSHLNAFGVWHVIDLNSSMQILSEISLELKANK